ncbi:molybdate transport system permease protein [Raineyella antarctica]|uniref:Molybdenum transport system permease n=1 Tax=Raineyella antarctica TaxID=1577474 RepID=A0A1G6I1X3_9ACTN|nr:ABC transporter permease [Raineyella antarctica]SDB99736.1 molybdate transport system permease protein [Raineyella antarctica]
MRRSRSQRWLFAVPAALSVLGLSVPLAALVGRALTQGTGHLVDPAIGAAVRLSLATSAISTLVVIALGTPLAYVMARYRFRGRGLVQLVIDLPIVLPPMVAGIGLLMAFGRQGLLGAPLSVLGISLPFTTVAVVMAQAFVAGPFFVRSATIGFAAVDRSVREAAAVEGATELEVFRKIEVPLAARPIGSGIVLAWARAVGEFGATIFFAGNREGVTQTMPLLIFVGFETEIEVAIALSVVLVAMSAVVLGVLRLLDRPGVVGH